MTEQEFKLTPTYLGWSPGARKTFQAFLVTYRALRHEVGPFVYITRHMLTKAHGTTHVGTASKFQGHIEEIEDDQPPRPRRATAPRSPDSTEPAPLAIQTAFDGVRQALEVALKTVIELRAQDGLELAEQCQRLQREYLAGADAREQALAERIADLEAASSGAGEESWDNAAAADELRSALQAANSERDAAVARAEQADHDRELDRVRLAAAETLVQAMQAGAINHAAEVMRLQQELKANEEAAAEATKLRADLVVISTERDAAVGQATQAAHTQHLNQVQRAAAEALVEALQAGAALQSAEVSRLQQELKAQEGAVAEAAKLRAESRALTNRVDALADQIRQQQNDIVEMNRRHEEEQAAVRAAHDDALAEERWRAGEREAKLLAWFGSAGRGGVGEAH